MNKRIVFFSLLFLCAACIHRGAIHCEIIDQIATDYVQEYAEPRGLLLSGYGGAMMGNIQRVTLSFISFDALNV